ncbi:MAG TPA: hypothetical protein VGD62_06335 [Acidobacteriaceae bacterium]
MSASDAILSHRYFMSSDYSGGAGAVELPPPPWQRSIHAELRYPYDVLEQALPLVRARGLHFYFTKEAYFLPEYGPHVVSMLLQEERCKVPVYGRYIRATIRNLMPRPFLGWRLHPRIGRSEAVLTFEYTRDWYTHLKSVWARAHPPRHWPSPIRKEPLDLRIPLGYHSQEDIPYVPIKDRTLDMFFAGQVRHPVPRNDYRYWTSTSKFQVREQLWRELSALQKTGEWNIDLGAIASTDSKRNEQAFNTYTEKMMNTRICLAPRGTLPDTFRHFEGMRAGCLVVSNPVPVEPYLYGAPMLLIDHWSEIHGILKKHGRDNDFIQEMGDRGRAWWNNRLTPQIIGRSIADQLNADSLDAR